MSVAPLSLVDDLPAFDLTGPLPRGLTLLEASAGTGKTYTVAALVARYLAEGVATLDQLLIVTFGRAASQELRERVRVCLFATELALADPGRARIEGDAFVRQLATGDSDEIAERRGRLGAALSDFDAASIATTHQFCQQVLAMLGVAGDADPDATLVENLDDLLVQVVDDLYVRRFAAPEAPVPPFDHATALAIGRQVAADPQAHLEPAEAAPGSVAAARFEFGREIRAEFAHRKRVRGVLDYDDLLSRLADSLDPALAGPAAFSARERMRSRWSIVLVDEFQDTDPSSGRCCARRSSTIGRRSREVGEVPSSPTTLVLIGDPKQAIYGFRGGDVVTYLQATRTAGKATLATNWRTDSELVDRLQVLLGGAELGATEIVVRPVTASHPGSRLAGPNRAPLRLRRVPRQLIPGQATSLPPIRDVREHIGADLTADIVRLLNSAAAFDGHPVRAGHIAVLVNTNANAAEVQGALSAAGVPAVLGGSGSVYGSAAAADWQVLLEALEQPHRADRVRSAALTPFLGYSAAELDAGGADLTDRLTTVIAGWAALLSARGIAAVLEVITDTNGLWSRTLAWRGGERRLTDLRHIGEDLHVAARQEALGRGHWPRGCAAGAPKPRMTRTGSGQRRLDSDAAAVQILTVHGSKGLEFPIVYLPFAFDRWVNDSPDFLQLHEAGRRVLDVGGGNLAGTSPDDRTRRRERVAAADAEQDAEALRVLYVGLTRAQSQLVVWWAPTKNTPRSGLHRVLFGRDRPVIRGEVPVPPDRDVSLRLEEWANLGGLAVEMTTPGPVAEVYRTPSSETTQRSVRLFNRSIDLGWRRSSFSSLTADADHASAAPGVESEPESADRIDETLAAAVLDDPLQGPGGPPGPPPLDGADTGAEWPASAMADLPAGTLFGTLVHAVLEEVDFASPTLDDDLLAHCREQLSGRAGDFSPRALATALAAVVRSPLTHSGLTLASFGRGDRLAELLFELPLAGGDNPTASHTLGELGPLLTHHLPVDDPVAGYAVRLTDPDLSDRPLRGYLNGSIDAVLRLRGADGVPAYTVVDYKTNWLGPPPLAAEPGSVLSTFHYRPSAVAAAMAGSDYPLQALLYSVALHRFLRWRQPDYDPERHLAGIKYLFVRGMVGPATPIVNGTPCGVFDWRPPVPLIEALSALLDGDRR